MKKRLIWIIAAVVVLALAVGLFLTQCQPEQPVVETPTEPNVVEDVDTYDYNLEKALEYLRVFYKDTPEKTPTDYTRLGTVRVSDSVYEIVWTVEFEEGMEVDPSIISIIINEDGSVSIDLNEDITYNMTTAVPYKLIATLTGTDGRVVSYTWEHIIPAGIDDEALAIVDAAYALKEGEALEGTYTLTGTIISIDTMYSEQYGNITVTMVVRGREDFPIKCYRLKGAGVENLAVGDIITVTGTLKNYYGTIEFDAGCILENVVSGGGTPPKAPEDPKEILKEAFALKSGQSLPYSCELTGKIVQVDYPYDPDYDNISVTMLCEGKKVYCYRLKGDRVEELNVNDVITVSGVLSNYQGTVEFAYGTLVGLVNNPAPVQPSDPTKVVDAAYKLADGDYLPYEATLTGKVSSVKYYYDTEYGTVSLYMVIEGRESKPIYCFNMGGSVSNLKSVDVGDTITVRGNIKNYQGTIEFVYPDLIKLVKGENIPAPEDPAQIIDEAYALGVGETLPYRATLTGTITRIKDPYSIQYKNLSVIIVVEGSEDQPILCYRMKGSGADKLEIGDVIKVTGSLTNYNGTIEFNSGCTFELISGGNGGGSTVEVPEPGKTVTVEDGTYLIVNGNQAATALAEDYNYGYMKFDKVVINDGEFSGYDPEEVFTITNTRDGAFTIQDCYGRYVYLKDDYNSFNVASERPATGTFWFLKEAGEDTYYLMNKLTEKYIAFDSAYGSFGAYADLFEGSLLYFVEADPNGVEADEVEVVVNYGPLEENTDYNLYLNQVTNGQDLYFNGLMDNGYLGTTENVAAAVRVQMEIVEDEGVRFFYTKDGVKTYIEIYLNSSGKGRPALKTEPTCVFNYNEEAGTYVVSLGGDDYFLGTYSTYETISASSTYYITGANAGTVGYTQFVAELIAADSSSGSVEEEEEDVEIDLNYGPLKTNTAYNLYLNQVNLGQNLFFNGAMSGQYLGTSTKAADAVKVYMEKVTGEGVRFYFMDGSTKTYIEIYTNSEGSIRPVLNTTPTCVFNYDEDAGTYVVPQGSNVYYLGTYNTYSTISTSSTYYITGGNAANVGVSQFVAEWIIPGSVEETEQPDVSDDPAADSKLTIEEAIALGASKAHNTYTEGKYYVTGEITEVYNTTYGNMYIKDANGKLLTVYGTFDADGTNRYDAMSVKPVAGDTVTVYGVIGQYNGTPQMKNGWIVEHVPGEGTGGEEPDVSDDPAADSTLTIQEAAALGASKAHNTYTAGKYYVTGEITEVYNTQYGNMYIKDASGNILTIYGTFDADGTNRYDAMSVKPVAGDTVTVYGIIGQYNGTPQMKNGWIVEHVPAEGGDDDTTYDIYGPLSENTAYHLAMVTAENTYVYFNGTVRGSTVYSDADVANAVEMQMEKVEGEGVRFYIANGETKSYLEMYATTSGSVRPILNTEPTCVFTYNKAGVYSVVINDVEYFFGNTAGTADIKAVAVSELGEVAGCLVAEYIIPGSEEGDDTTANTLTIEEAIALGASQDHNTYTDEKYYVTGEITEVYNTTYGNMRIKDEAGNILTVYGSYDADGTNRYDAMSVKPVAGDTVTVYGIIGQYNDVPQMKNGWIVEHVPAEGGDDNTGDDTTATTLTIQEAIALGASQEHNTYTNEKYYVTGEITEVYNTTYGNMRIKDASGNILTVYGSYDADGTNRYDAMSVKPVAGDTVTVYGIIGQYNDVPQMKNGWIVEHVPGEGADDEEPDVSDDPAADSTLTIQEAAALGASKAHNTYTTNKYYVTGEITEVYNTQYGNMYIKDASGNTLTVYGTYDEDGTNRYDAMSVQPVAGDTITVYGIIGQYNGTAQMKNGWIVEHVSGEDTGDDNTGDDDTTGDDTTTITLTSGEYVITASNGVVLGVVDGTWITAGDATSAWTLTVTDDTATLCDANGVYVAPKASNSNGISTSEYSWTVVENDDGSYSFVSADETVMLAYNSDSRYLKFRGYKVTTVNGDPDMYPYTFTLAVAGSSSSGGSGDSGDDSGSEDETTELDTLEKQITAANALANGAYLDVESTITGTITDTPAASSYTEGAYKFTVSDGTNSLLCYYVPVTGGTPENGDTVTVTGKLTAYNGAAQFDGSAAAVIVEKGEAAVAPTDPKEIVDAAFALSTGESLPYECTLTGVITEIVSEYSEQYKNITVNIEVEGSSGTKILQCYRVKGTGAESLAVGDTITVTGTIINYNGTIEFNSGCTLDNVVSA